MVRDHGIGTPKHILYYSAETMLTRTIGKYNRSVFRVIIYTQTTVTKVTIFLGASKLKHIDICVQNGGM